MSTLDYETYVGDIPDAVIKQFPKGIVGVDIEILSTAHQDDFTNPDKGEIGSIAFWWEGYNKGAILDNPYKSKNLKQYLTDKYTLPIFHNFAFDGNFIWNKLGFMPNCFGDTKILAKIKQEENTSLFFLLKKYITEDPILLPDKNLTISNWTQPVSRWDKVMIQYVINDVRHLKSLLNILQLKITTSQSHLYRSAIKLLPTLIILKNNYTDISFGDLNFIVEYGNTCSLIK